MIHTIHLSGIALLAGAALLAGGVAHSQASGDGFQGPVTFGTAQLDESLTALNRELQLRYIQDDTLAGLIAPVDPDYSTLVVAARETLPEINPAAPRPDEFRTLISGDASLQDKVATIGSDLRDDTFAVYVELARLSTDGLEDAFDDGLAETSSFGPAIAGDATLDAKMAHVFDLVGNEKARVLLQDAPARSFDDATLDGTVAAVRLIAN